MYVENELLNGGLLTLLEQKDIKGFPSWQLVVLLKMYSVILLLKWSVGSSISSQITKSTTNLKVEIANNCSRL